MCQTRENTADDLMAEKRLQIGRWENRKYNKMESEVWENHPE